MQNQNLIGIVTILLTGWAIAPSGLGADEIDRRDSSVLRQQFEASADGGQAFRSSVANAVLDHPAVAGTISIQRGAVADIATARAARRVTVDSELTGDVRIAESFEDRFDNILERSRPDERINASIIAHRLIYDAGAAKFRIESAKAKELGARHNVAAAASDIALSAVAVHFDVLRYQLLLSLADSHVARHDVYALNIQERFDQGVGVARDVARITARRSDTIARRITFESALLVASATYQEIFGQLPHNLQHPGWRPVAPTDRTMAFSNAQSANPRLLGSEAEMRAAGRAYAAVKADGKSKISLRLTGTKFDLNRSVNDYAVLGQIVFTRGLYSGGRRSAGRNKAFEILQGSRAAHDAERRRVRQSVQEALILHSSLSQQVTLQAEAFDANGLSRDLFVQQFEVSRGSLLEVLEAEEDYFQAAVSFVNGMADFEIAAYRLLHETGDILHLMNIPLSMNISLPGIRESKARR